MRALHTCCESCGLVLWCAQEGCVVSGVLPDTLVSLRICCEAAVDTQGILDFPETQQPHWEVCMGVSLVASVW